MFLKEVFVNLFLMRLLNFFAAVMLLCGVQGYVHAAPQSHKMGEFQQKKMELRQQHRKEFLAKERLERKNARDVNERKLANHIEGAEGKANVVPPMTKNNEAGERRVEKFKRLSLEERIALRKQIRDAGIEIYAEKRR
jgi:hypothetical protein